MLPVLRLLCPQLSELLSRGPEDLAAMEDNGKSEQPIKSVLATAEESKDLVDCAREACTPKDPDAGRSLGYAAERPCQPAWLK